MNSTVDNSIPLIKLISTGNVTLPDFASLNSVPLIGDKLYAARHGLLDMGGAAIMAKIRPYIGTTTTGSSVRRRISANCWSIAG